MRYQKLTEEKPEDIFSDSQKAMTFLELLYLLRPYFWPNEGSDGAIINRIRAVSTWLMVTLSKVCGLCAPFYLASAANFIEQNNFHSSIKPTVIYIALRIAASVFKEMQSLIYVKVSQQAGIELQELVFRHLHTLSLNWHISKKTGGVVKSMDRGIAGVGTLITYLFLFLIPSILECIAVVLLFFLEYEQWGLGLSVFIGVSLYAAVTIFITEIRKKYREKTNKMDNEYHDKATDSIINFETVKYFTAEPFEVKRYKESVVKFQSYSASTSYSGNVLNISQQIILWGSMLSAMLVSGYAVSQGQLSLGDWVAVQSWVTVIFAPLNFLGSVYSSIVQALVDVHNLSQLLSESPDVTDEPRAQPIPILKDHHRQSTMQYSHMPNKTPNSNIHTNTGDLNDSYSLPITNNDKKYQLPDKDDDINTLVSPLLMNGSETDSIYTTTSFHTHNGSGASMGNGVSVEFKNVYFHYPTQSPDKGLKNVSFYVPAGTTTAIVGHTGSGKTTISRLLFRFYDPLQGSVLLSDCNIRQYTQQSVRSCIGIVPQDTVLFNDTILYNVRYGRLDATLEEVQAAADAAHIREFIESLADGWETKVGERGLKLSGGEKQRVAIARCLLKDPPVVLLDEATSALDTVTEHSVQEALTALGANRTVLIIAHRLSTIKHADQIIVLDGGSIVESGTHDQLLERDQYYARLWNMQIQSNSGLGLQSSSSSSLLSNIDGDRKSTVSNQSHSNAD